VTSCLQDRCSAS